MFWKRFFIVIGILVILAFLAQLLVAPHLKDFLTKAVKDSTGIDISVGDCELSMLQRRIVLSDIVIMNPENKDDYLLRAKEVSADFYFLPILFNKQILRTISITGPEVILYLDESGKVRLPQVKQDQKKVPGRGSSELLFKKLEVKDGNFKFIDRKVSKPATITQFSGINGKVVNSISLSDRAVITSVNVKGIIEGQGAFSVDGKGAFLQKPMSFDGAIEIANVPLPKFSPYYGNNLSVKVNRGDLYIDTKALCIKGALNVKSEVRIENADLEPVGDPTQTVLFEIKTSDVIKYLKDENNTINFSFEINGDLNKPDFKWGAEMVHALKNSMLKALTDGALRSLKIPLKMPAKAGETINDLIGGEAGETAKKIGEKLQDILGK